MNKHLVLGRLRATIEKLLMLPECQFAYDRYVTVANGECGTVCCVAGWYPQWFPEAGLKWQSYGTHLDLISTSHQDEYYNQQESLIDYHGLSENLIEVLFYGYNRDISRNNNWFNRLIYGQSIRLGIGDKPMRDASLQEIIILFRQVFNLIAADKIVWHK